MLQDDACSLHLTQKFAMWYPSTRLTPILSSKSAPGLIVATGVYGKTMKGHASVYISRDAGVTWRQVSERKIRKVEILFCMFFSLSLFDLYRCRFWHRVMLWVKVIPNC